MNMNKAIKILSSSLFVIIGCIILMSSEIKDDDAQEEFLLGEAPFKNVEYQFSNKSCLTFYDNNEFSEYDCYDNPTNMPFSDDFYDKYYYDRESNIIIFKGKNEPDAKLRVLKWTEDSLNLKLLNKSDFNETIEKPNSKGIYDYKVRRFKMNTCY